MLTTKEWLPDTYRTWVYSWFSELMLDEAIIRCGLTVNKLTKVEVFPLEPTYYNPREKVEDRRTGYRRLTLEYGGHTWERTETYTGSAWRIRDDYQHLRLPELTVALMGMRLPWFHHFKWAVYGHPREYGRERYEIYLHVGERDAHMTLYVPIDDLLSGNVEGIAKRTLDYANRYGEDIVREGMTKAMDSDTARLLFDYMKGVRV